MFISTRVKCVWPVKILHQSSKVSVESFGRAGTGKCGNCHLNVYLKLRWRLIDIFELFMFTHRLTFQRRLHVPFTLMLGLMHLCHGSVLHFLSLLQNHNFTRMVQLPATAAIEYVAACCRTRTRMITKTKTKTRTKIRTRMRTKTGTKTKIGTITKIVRGAYARSPQDQCLYALSRLSVPSIVAWLTNKQNDKKNRQTQPPSSAGSWPPSPNFQGV